MGQRMIVGERLAPRRDDERGDEGAEIDERRRQPRAEQTELRQAEQAMNQAVDQREIRRDRRERDPQRRGRFTALIMLRSAMKPSAGAMPQARPFR